MLEQRAEVTSADIHRLRNPGEGKIAADMLFDIGASSGDRKWLCGFVPLDEKDEMIGAIAKMLGKDVDQSDARCM